MSKEALDEVKNNYEKVIESGEVWKLKSGWIVEQVMMNYSLKSEVFAEQELNEIGDFSSIDSDQQLLKLVYEYLYLYSFLGKKTLRDLNATIADKTFNPSDEPDLYQIREVVDLNNMNFFDSD
ncbi:hypothetical protein INT45_010701 [Circinella minor]|uniref:Uncharacterized protein n=1 Tax=Circinella minor TaxID=1195481 RepID=A0A8H7S3T1_9FUNG|nr:hypothetical protein INT45_010701 [Circinella minor]